LPEFIKRNGTWTVRWREGGRGGKYLRKSGFATKGAAESFAATLAPRIAASLKLSASAAVGAMPLATLIERWIDRGRSEGRDAYYLASNRKQLLDLTQAMGWTLPGDVTPAEVARWRGIREGRNARLGAVLRACLRWAHEALEQPLHQRALVALRPPSRKRKAPKPLIDDDHLAACQARAQDLGGCAPALLHGLSTYGWRPITAARLRVRDLDLDRGEITLDVKMVGAHKHPLFPATLALLRPLVHHQPDHAPLFRTETGAAFGLGCREYCLSNWWRKRFPGMGPVYDLKRWALSRMQAGAPPWPRPLTLAEIRRFTGHRTTQALLIYLRDNDQTARDLVTPAAAESGCTVGAPKRTLAKLPASRRSGKTA
jgi:hypothetical protein